MECCFFALLDVIVDPSLWSIGCFVVAWAMGLAIGVLTMFAFIR